MRSKTNAMDLEARGDDALWLEDGSCITDSMSENAMHSLDRNDEPCTAFISATIKFHGVADEVETKETFVANKITMKRVPRPG